MYAMCFAKNLKVGSSRFPRKKKKKLSVMENLVTKNILENTSVKHSGQL